MYIFSIFLSYFSYLIFFLVFYFGTEKFFSWELIVKWKRSKIVDDLLFGFFIGIISLIIQLINNVIYNDAKIPLFVSTLLLLVIFKNYNSGLASMIPGFIHYLFVFNKGNSIYVTLFFSLIIALIIHWFKVFVEKKQLSFLYSVLLLFAFVTITSIGVYKIFYYDIKKVLINISYIYFLTLMGYYIMKYIVNFTISSKLLYESSQFSFLKFYRPKIATQMINEFLFQNKIQYGYLVLFKLKYDNEYAKIIEANSDANIENHFYKLVQDLLLNHGITFNYQKNENGFFIPLKNLEIVKQQNSLLLNKIIKTLNKNFVWGEKEIPLKMTASFGISKYGIDSQNINRLIRYSSFALNDQPQNINKITFFNWNIHQSFLRDNIDINNLDAIMQLDDLSNSYTPLYNLKKRKNFATYVEVKNISEFQLYETVRENVYIKNYQNTFDRYFASSALLNSNNNKVIINFSPTIFEDKFSIQRFEDFFKRNNINYRLVYFLFDKRGIDRIKNVELVQNMIAKIETLGIKIIIPNSYLQAKKLFKNVQYTFVNAQNLSKFKRNYKNAHVICFDLLNLNDVLKAHKNKIKILGGPMFDQEFIFTKFTKQSKIYLENIIKGASNG